MISKLNGLIAAPFTPMHADGSLNLAMIERQSKLLAENEVKGAFICGTTGEGLSLTTDERLQVAEKWIAAAPQSLKIIVHVGHASIGESRILAAHAEKLKASAIATIGPTFFRITNVEQLVEFCARIAAAAPSIPFYYYHMPAMTGVDLPMHDFLKLAGDRIPNLAGIKFTHENLMDYSRCLNFDGGRYDILFGRDEILLAALALGATGAVGSTYNYMAPIYQEMIKAFNAQDLKKARDLQSHAIQIISIMSRRGGLPAGKVMMKLAGYDCGPVRAPLRNLSPESQESFARELEVAGFPLQKRANPNPSSVQMAAIQP
jgi:N-acetylneuraminate lyase